MAFFRLEWVDGTNSLNQGESIEEALCLYGEGAFSNLQSYKELDLSHNEWTLRKSEPFYERTQRDIYTSSIDYRIERQTISSLETNEVSYDEVGIRGRF